ncbi:MAG TPA: hypothetical protein GXX20_01730 [Clostridiaceae bacterium]|nr:hypothetical protein [Clostridiaceae bacterium]
MRFVVMSDTHFYVEDKVKHSIFWNRSLPGRGDEIARNIVDSIKEKQPDFVIHCGDLIDRGYKECFEFAKAIMDDISVPWFMVPGNHDTLEPITRHDISSLYGLPLEQNYYSKDIGPIHFIFLDTCYMLAADGRILPCRDENLKKQGLLKGFIVPPEELKWLKQELEANKNKNVIIVSHLPLKYKNIYPVSTLPDGTAIESGKGCSPKLFTDALGIHLINENEVTSLFKGYINIKAVFSGHWHLNDVYKEDGIVYCQTCSLREYPFEFRVIDLIEGASGKYLEVTTHPLLNSEFAQESYVEDRNNSWIKGSPEDRTFTISL